MWPRKAWDGLYEPRVRASACLGIAPAMADTDSYTQRYAHCDDLVIGAGPAGLIAASEAAATGARVNLCVDHAAMGGSLLSAIGSPIEGRGLDIWLDDTLRDRKRPRLNSSYTCAYRLPSYG